MSEYDKLLTRPPGEKAHMVEFLERWKAKMLKAAAVETPTRAYAAKREANLCDRLLHLIRTGEELPDE